MRKILVAAILIMALSASCIGQKTEFTVEDWKEHLSFVKPSVGQSSGSMVSGFNNLEDLPTGTHMVFKIIFVGTSEGMDIPLDITVGFTIAGKEVVDGIDTVRADITQNMEMDAFGETMTMTFEGQEWMDLDGAPVKMEGTASTEMAGMEILLSFTFKRIGEEQYHGHDCWILEMVETMEMAGMPETEIKMTMYVDKESYSVVRMLTKMGEEEVDTGYIEPVISLGDIVWELGDRETITTEFGTYDCQVIHLKENGETIGTIWANEDIRAPIKYVISYKSEDTEFGITMILLEYELG